MVRKNNDQSPLFSFLGVFLLFFISLGGLILAYLIFQKPKKEVLEVIETREFLETDKSAISPSISPPKIFVDLAGGIENPSVYQLEEGVRLQELIDLAGGFSDEVDMDYVVKNINLARKLNDEEKIFIPLKNNLDSKEGTDNQLALPIDSGRVSSPSEGEVLSNSKININSASQSQLEGLSGIGPVKAKSIIENRPYFQIEDLLEVKGIGSATLEKIRDRITL